MELARVEGREIVIRVPIAALRDAFASIDAARDEHDRVRLRVADVVEFADEVCEWLNYESEDGSTPVTDAFDQAMAACVNFGFASGVEEVSHEQA